MPFEDIVIDETAARKIAAILLQGIGTEGAIPGANAAAAVIAGLSPLRNIIPGENGTITIAPADPE